MRLHSRVEYIGSDPIKKWWGAGSVIDMRPNPLRPDEVTVNWANMTPTTEKREDLRVLTYQETTGQYLQRVSPGIGGDWLKQWKP